ncbi:MULTISPECIES: division/cell wall cluster transcriptional repressor MraZ [Weeksella]|nr:MULTISPECIES: division/cell wall cluster transcriptional repressor MraZ [Weeksella]MDK7374365.1 division/cell wall cluster transcriptional repressor MraZ [Weeksella virosa]MDK7675688.1 division/cell wall cluster transcriptional repressor MraZ [Weeksella virosa]OFM81953.1 division/cell wall cluster transcriptional repressor MraZ [Weeksella sp. HMSC059D05]
MNSLFGTYECKVDAKGRLPLPAGVKKQLAEVMEDGFVLKRAIFQQCLEIHPIAEFRAKMAKINKLNRFIRKNDEFIRRFTAGVREVEVDANSRLQLSKDLIGFAKIDKDVVLVLNIDVIEVWDKEEYEKVVSADFESFADLAEEVMGNQNDEFELS